MNINIILHFLRIVSDRSKHQVNLLGAEVNRDSVKPFDMPPGLTEADFRAMTLEVDSKMRMKKVEVRKTL